MKRIWGVVFLLLISGFFLFSPKPTIAQTAQNVVLSCLDATRLPPPPWQTFNGVAYHHLLSLKNKELNVFSPNQPVYIIRSTPKVFCDPRLNDPACVKVEPEQLQRCYQETMGADICNRDCPWAGSPSCTPNNVGPGKTLCCMADYRKPGPYFQCAKDVNGEVVCPSSILSTNGQAGGIHVAEDGHIETGLHSSFILISNTKSNLLADAEGNIFIATAQSHTLVGSEHSFYGLQVLSDDAMNQNEAFRNSLKLAVFAEIETIEPSATNCTTVFWDPYGKIIDSLRLEPISGAGILLRNLNAFGQVVNTSVPNNPAFRNPDQTDEFGDYNFTVNPGVYFLSPSHPSFTFPSDPTAISSALSALAVKDPNQEYIARDKVYNNSEEQIIETQGESQRRDIIMTPKDPNYPGTPPVILYAENLRNDNGQMVRGRVSHPKSVIKIYVGNNQVGQTEASWKGAFSITIPSEVFNSNSGELQIVAEKVPLTQTKRPTTPLLNLFARIIKQALAQETTTSRPYKLSMVPVRLTGFVFDPKLQVKPNSVVKLKIPSMGNLTYSQTKADEDGFIDVSSTNLPPFDFVIAIEDPDEPNESYQLTIDDFKKTNSILYEETNTNIYNAETEIVKPDAQTIARIVKETPRRVNPSTLSYNQPTLSPRVTTAATSAQATPTSSSSVFVFALIGAIAVGGAIILVLKSRAKKRIYY